MRDHYFTTEHEWFDFQGAVAFIGVCNYKVSKLKTIEKIVFPKSSGIKKKGDVLAVIYAKIGKIPVHMPVDGKILNLKNIEILTDLENFLQQSEKDRWLAFIGLLQPYERKGLMQIDQYKHFIKKGS
jgi:glycine cleavage system H protein